MTSSKHDKPRGRTLVAGDAVPMREMAVQHAAS